jgi:hypothetical protein
MTEKGTWLSPGARGEYIPFSVVKDCVSREEVDALRRFVEAKIPASTNDSSEVSQVVELYNRPDAWDDSGVIDKFQVFFRQYIKENFFLTGILEPRKFILLRTDELQSYEENYEDFVDNGEAAYIAIATLNDDYKGGDTIYRTGEGITSPVGGLSIHRAETLNSWKISDVVVGTRFDLVLVVIERPVEARYDEFAIEQSVDDGIDY